MNPMPRLAALRRDPIAWAAIVYALFWGWLALVHRPIGDFGIETDFYGDYARYAREWMSTGPTLMNGFRGPAYYVLLGLLGGLVRDYFLVGKVLSVLAAGAVLILTGSLVRRLWTPLAGLTATLLVASSLTFIDYSYRACTDLVFLAFTLGAMRLLFAERGRAWLVCGAAGVLAGLAWMTRYNGLVLLPGGLAVALIVHGLGRGGRTRAGAFLAGWIVIAAPWLVFVAARTGHPFWNKAYENIAIEVLADDPHRAQLSNFMGSIDLASAGDVLSISPGLFARTMFRNLVGHGLQDARQMVGWPWAAVAALGAILAWSTWRRRPTLAFLALGGLTYASLLPVFYSDRFMLPLLPWWGAAAGGLLVAVERWGGSSAPAPSKESRRRKPAATGLRPAVAGALALLALLAVVQNVRGYRLARDPGRFGGMPLDYLEIVKQVSGRGYRFDRTTPIAARKPHIGFLLGAPVVPMPTGAVSDLKNTGVNYLFVSGSEINSWPSLTPLWMPRQASEVPSSLTLIGMATSDQGRGQVTGSTLYAVNGASPQPPKTSSPFVIPPPPPPGLSRLDNLRLQVASWYLRSGSLRDPGEMLRVMTPAGRNHPRALVMKGDAALRRNDPAAADAAYRQALAADPKNRGALLGLATSAWLTGRFEETQNRLVEVFGVPPGRDTPDPEVLTHDAEMSLKEGSAVRALAVSAAAIDLGWNPRQNRIALAYALSGLFRFDETRRLLQAMLQADPNDREAQQMLRSLDDIQKYHDAHVRK